MLALSRLIGIIHEYQTDSSSKPPAPESVMKKNVKKIEKNEFWNLTKVVPYQPQRGDMITLKHGRTAGVTQ